MDEKDKMMTNQPTQAASASTKDTDNKADAVSMNDNQAANQPSVDAQVATAATETVPAPQPAIIKPKNKKMPLIIAGIVALVAVVAVAAYMMLGVSKTDYKEALTNIEDGEKSLTKQFDKANRIMKTGPGRSTESDRKELEELTKKNQQAMDEVAKLKAVTKDAELKKKFEELRDQQKKLDEYGSEVIETVYDVAPVMNKLGKISQQSTPKSQLDYARTTVDEIKKIEPKAGFNKDFVENVTKIFNEMFEKIDRAIDGENVNLDALKNGEYITKARQTTSKWMKEVRERAQIKNMVKDNFDSVKSYLKSKTE